MKEISIMDVGGFKIGHAQNLEGGTGCTAVLFDALSPAGVDVRGGGPASRETPLLNPVADAKGIHAILLSGGSAFGLDAAGGVMKYLEEHNIGFDVGVTKVPLVCQSCLFDLPVGDVFVRPDQAMAYAACENASYDVPEEGNVGAGTGCTVGKIMGMEHCMKSGIGTYAVQVGDIKVGAIVAVNALGDVYDPETGKEIAGLTVDGKLASSEEVLWNMVERARNFYTDDPAEAKAAAGSDLNMSNTNTTIGIVITNAKFDKTALNKIASMTHNGYARAIRPVHTMADGDSIYAVSTGEVPSDINAIGSLSAYVMSRAIRQAVLSAKDAYGLKGLA